MTMGVEGTGWHWRNGAGGALARAAPALALDLRHGADLGEVMGQDAPRWTDALAGGTLRQIEDCLLGAEQAIVLHLGERPFDTLMASLPPGFTRAGLRRFPALLSPQLLRHMRQRAAIVLVRPQPAAMPDLALSPDLREALARYASARIGWEPADGQNGAGPARADLPAELYHDLAWTAAALVAEAIEAMVGAASPSAVHAVARATELGIARHDEGQGTIARAMQAARLVDDDQAPDLARTWLAQGELLPFAALVAHRHALALDALLDALIDGPLRDRLAILRLAGTDDSAAAAFFGQVAPLRFRDAGESDIALMVELYRAFSTADATGWLARRVGPEPLAARLALIDRAGA